MSLSDSVEAYYKARAEEYDVSAGYTDNVAEELRAPIKLRFQEAMKGHDVLEIACGTGYWTEVIAETADSVLATDIDPRMISIAEARLSSRSNVQCRIADAYTLDGIEGPFTAAFSHWWWSHIPKSRLSEFLAVLHNKLTPGALVLFSDSLPFGSNKTRNDNDGNRLEERILQDGRRFEVVKNFPTERELKNLLDGLAEDIVYREYPEQCNWELTYRILSLPPCT
jgi:SAM-dependent methyltransferase